MLLGPLAAHDDLPASTVAEAIESVRLFQENTVLENLRDVRLAKLLQIDKVVLHLHARRNRSVEGSESSIQDVQDEPERDPRLTGLPKEAELQDEHGQANEKGRVEHPLMPPVSLILEVQEQP